MGIGRWLLLHFNELFAADGVVGPHVLLLSGTSWAGRSPAFHVQATVDGILRAPDEEVQAIEDSRFRFEPFSDDQGRLIRVSGRLGNNRLNALKTILKELATPGGLGGPSRLEYERSQLPAGRKRILLLVGNYNEAKQARETLENLRPDLRGQVSNLVRDDEALESEWVGSEYSLPRGLVHQLADTEAWILIAPLLAIERGHNILNEQHQAALGAAYFLVRPHPRPDDIGYAIQSINRWAVEHCQNPEEWSGGDAVEPRTAPYSLAELGTRFRQNAYRRWRYLLNLPLIYSTLPDREREAVTWNELVTIWQVIGRLIRGGSPARVYFCDAAFRGNTSEFPKIEEEDANESMDQSKTSLLIGIREVLRPYFTESPVPAITPRERLLVQSLYGPFYRAFEQMEGI